AGRRPAPLDVAGPFEREHPQVRGVFGARIGDVPFAEPLEALSRNRGLPRIERGERRAKVFGGTSAPSPRSLGRGRRAGGRALYSSRTCTRSRWHGRAVRGWCGFGWWCGFGS